MNTNELSAFDYFKLAINRTLAMFEGRSRRSEYWYFQLFTILFYIVPGILTSIFEATGSIPLQIVVGLISLIIMFVLLVPSVAVAVRRLHDTGRSGWYYLLALIPLVGGIILLVFLVQDSQPGSNKWGPNPKTNESDVIDHLTTAP
jgi:uncharacterized membrane protein YhaH (DUF805 family)